MRRVLCVVFILGVLACGLLLYWQRGKQDPNGSQITDTPSAVSLTTPRLASAAPSRVGSNGLPSTVPDAGNDTGQLVLDEQSLMKQLRAALTTNPWLAEILAREGQQRFPDSPDSDDCDMLLVGALFNEGRIGRARMQAYSYFEHHPNGRYVKDMSILTAPQQNLWVPHAGSGRCPIS